MPLSRCITIIFASFFGIFALFLCCKKPLYGFFDMHDIVQTCSHMMIKEVQQKPSINDVHDMRQKIIDLLFVYSQKNNVILVSVGYFFTTNMQDHRVRVKDYILKNISTTKKIALYE